MRLDVLWCSLCGRGHNGSWLADGWFADRLRHNIKGADSAKRLICPDCLARLGVVYIISNKKVGSIERESGNEGERG
ncbi:unnamed protein product [marine sediment metagenome]|uniref:Uncharacterized protein n=1 Tax=marine sediment metagenome TaxID=412755 RepID=X1TM00_9ZZZZ